MVMGVVEIGAGLLNRVLVCEGLSGLYRLLGVNAGIKTGQTAE
jgi:hypothetical protein